MHPPTPHPILQESFAIIDREIGPHDFNGAEYAILRRIIHTTADFEFKQWLQFQGGAIEAAIEALRQRVPIVVDVSMVRQGIAGMVSRTWQNPILTAVDLAETADPGRTRTETGLLRCWAAHPEALYVIGNAPTALLALCQGMETAVVGPACVIGAPVGFVSVMESKQALAQLPVPQIRVDGRKGGSAVAAAIVNALLLLACEAEAAGC